MSDDMYGELARLVLNPEADVASLFSLLIEVVRGEAPRASDSGLLNRPGARKAVVEALRRVAWRARGLGNAASVDRVRLLDSLRSLNERELEDLAPLELDHVRQRLRGRLKVLPIERHVDLPLLVAAHLLGAVAAHWLADEVDVDGAPQAFNAAFDAWLSLTSDSDALVFETSADLVDFLAKLQSTMRPSTRESGWLQIDMTRILTAKGACVIDLNHHLQGYFFSQLTPTEKRTPRRAVGRLYELFDELDAAGVTYLNRTFIGATSIGKVFLERALQASGLPIMATVLYTDQSLHILRDQVRALIDGAPSERPRLLVRKNLLHHGGHTVEVFPVDRLETALETAQRHDLFQTFLCCPYRDGYQRDQRVFLVGDRVGTVYERRAAEPLQRSDGTLLDALPSRASVLTNFCQGGSVTLLDAEQESELVELAIRVKTEIEEVERRFRTSYGVARPFDGIDFISVDMMRDHEGRARVGEVHMAADLPGEMRRQEARCIVDHALAIVQNSKAERLVLLGNEALGDDMVAYCDELGVDVERHTAK